jgi:hypothetical protein
VTLHKAHPTSTPTSLLLLLLLRPLQGVLGTILHQAILLWLAKTTACLRSMTVLAAVDALAPASPLHMPRPPTILAVRLATMPA